MASRFIGITDSALLATDAYYNRAIDTLEKSAEMLRTLERGAAGTSVADNLRRLIEQTEVLSKSLLDGWRSVREEELRRGLPVLPMSDS